jgi:hypothetical protein
LGLTVEQICLQHLNPPLVPRSREIPGDTQGKSFLLVEVEESGDAPHAIENNRAVYVRTGDASNPCDIADLEVVERLLQRRKSVTQRWEEFSKEAGALFALHTQGAAEPTLTIHVGPRYPSAELFDREKLFQLVNRAHYAGSPIFQTTYRHPVGAYGERWREKRPLRLGLFNTRGQLVVREQLQLAEYEAYVQGQVTRIPVFPFRWIAGDIHRAYSLCAAILNHVDYPGQVVLNASIANAAGRNFSVETDLSDGLELSSKADIIPASGVGRTDSQPIGVVQEVVADVVAQLFWPLIPGDSYANPADIARLKVPSWFPGQQYVVGFR